MRARPPSIVHSFRGGYRPAEKIPVRDTAPQKSGPSLSPGSGCSAPAGTALNSSSRRLNTSLFIPISRRRSPDQPLSSPPGDRRHGNAQRAPVAFHRPEKRAFGGWGEFEGGRPLCARAKGAFPPQQNTRLTPRCPAPRHAASGPVVRRPPRSGDRDGRTDARPPAARARNARH